MLPFNCFWCDRFDLVSFRSFFVWVFVLFLVSGVSASLGDGLVAYYPLNEKTGLIASDLVGSNDGNMEGYVFNHGVRNGGEVFV